MSSGSSLATLQGNKAKADKAIADDAAKQAQAGEENQDTGAEDGEGDQELSVEEVMSMTGAQIDALVKQHELGVPAGWSVMKVPAKRQWLIDQLQEPEEETTATAEEPAPETEAAPETAAETAPAPEAPAAPKSALAALAGEAKKNSKKGKKAAEPAAEPEAAPVEEEEAKEPRAEEPEAAPQVPAVADGKKGGGKKGGSKAVSPSKILEGEILSGTDLIQEVAAVAENLDEKSARALVPTLADDSDRGAFKLGAVLAVIQQNGWYKPYNSFKDYVENECNMSPRSVAYAIALYNDLVNSKVAWETVRHVGWTKVKAISDIITPDNVADWVKIAEANTVDNLREIVRTHKKNAAGGQLTDQSEGAEAPKKVVTVTLKLHEDQKSTYDAALEKAQGIAGTDVKTAAFEFICLDYLNNAPSLAQLLQKHGAEKAVMALAEAFPGIILSANLNPTAEELAAAQEAEAAAEE